jgi:CRP-like cAMP-binding protein
MDDLDFTGTARSVLYDPGIARKCFESFGKLEKAGAGEAIFAEGDDSDKMYLLTEGEVMLSRGRKSLDIVKAGEVFGEMAAISRQPRSANAVARTACTALSLDSRQFRKAIESAPEFALMLMSIMITRLRMTMARLKLTKTLPDLNHSDESRVFDRRLLDELSKSFKGRQPQTVPAGHVIMKEGEGGVFMYVVMQGRIAVSVQKTVVEHIGQGGVFGEMAILDQSSRAATATAEIPSMLLSINRNEFLSLIRENSEFAVSLLTAITERLRGMTPQR